MLMCSFDVLKLCLPPHWISNELQVTGSGSTACLLLKFPEMLLGTSIRGQAVRSDSLPIHARPEMTEVTGLPMFSTEVD